jgi:hypothetical protein
LKTEATLLYTLSESAIVKIHYTVVLAMLAPLSLEHDAPRTLHVPWYFLGLSIKP